MRQVTRIDQTFEEQKKLTPIEFTHTLDAKHGWMGSKMQPNEFELVVLLGDSNGDGDMFAAYSLGCIYIYKGNLNHGVY